MLLSPWYGVLQRVLQLVVLRFRSREFRIGDRRAAPRDGDLAPSHRSTVADDGGPVFLAATSR